MHVQHWNRKHPEERRLQKFIGRAANTIVELLQEVYTETERAAKQKYADVPNVSYSLPKNFAGQMRRALQSLDPSREKFDGYQRQIVYGRCSIGFHVYIHFETNFEKTKKLNHDLAHALQHRIGDMVQPPVGPLPYNTDIDRYLRNIHYVKIISIVYTYEAIQISDLSYQLPKGDSLIYLAEKVLLSYGGAVCGYDNKYDISQFLYSLTYGHGFFLLRPLISSDINSDIKWFKLVQVALNDQIMDNLGLWKVDK